MLSEKLKEIREKSGLNQIEFGKRIAVSSTTYNAYETGKQYPRADVIKNICQEFNVSADWLLGVQRQHVQTSADALDAILELKRAGAAVRVVPIGFFDDEIASGIYTVLIFFDGVDIGPVIENAEKFDELIHKGTMTQEIMATWLEAEREKLGKGIASKIQKYPEYLAGHVAFVISEQQFNLSTPAPEEA